MRLLVDPTVIGSALQVNILVTNRGRRTSLPTVLYWFDGPPANNYLLATLEIKRLDPGDWRVFVYHLDALGRAGENVLAVQADPGQVLSELDEENNRAEVRFKVPELSLDLRPEKNTYAPWEEVVLASRVTNLFRQPFIELSLITEIKNGEGVLFADSRIIPYLAPMEAALIQIHWPAGADRREGRYAVLQTIQERTTAAAFEIRDPLAGVRGKVAAFPDPVYQGQEARFRYEISHPENETIGGLILKITAVHLDTGEVKISLERGLELPAEAALSGEFISATAGLIPGIYRALLYLNWPGFPIGLRSA